MGFRSIDLWINLFRDRCHIVNFITMSEPEQCVAADIDVYHCSCIDQPEKVIVSSWSLSIQLFRVLVPSLLPNTLSICWVSSSNL
jgi:hypothetical protein